MNLWKKTFQNEPVTTFKSNKNLKELIGSNKIENKIVKINKQKHFENREMFLVF